MRLHLEVDFKGSQAEENAKLLEEKLEQLIDKYAKWCFYNEH
jgi:hypothetical protein